MYVITKAVDESHMIGIVTITGGSSKDRYRTVLADGTIVCEYAGTAHAINLTNGDSIWQVLNPWSKINDCDDSIYDDYVD